MNKDWINVGKVLAIDPGTKVKCPKCVKADLEVIDVRCEYIIERELRCPICGAHSYLRLYRPNI